MLSKNALYLYKASSRLPSVLSSLPTIYAPIKLNDRSSYKYIHCSSSPKYKSRNSNKSSDDPELKSILADVYKDFGLPARKGPQYSADSDGDEGSNVEKRSEGKHLTKSEELKFETDIIYDFDEEVLLRKEGLWKENEKKILEKVTHPRGERGVFDIQQLVDYLKEINARNIAVISVPKEQKYVEQLVVCTGNSLRHVNAMAEKINKMYKAKKNKKDRFIVIEGEGSDWVALDLENIAVHIMIEEVREEKDIESLWTIGVDRDEEWENPYAHLQNTYSYSSNQALDEK